MTLNSKENGGLGIGSLYAFNIFIWHLLLNKIPTRVNLANKGMDIPCTLCPACNVQ